MTVALVASRPGCTPVNVTRLGSNDSVNPTAFSLPCAASVMLSQPLWPGASDKLLALTIRLDEGPAPGPAISFVAPPTGVNESNPETCLSTCTQSVTLIAPSPSVARGAQSARWNCAAFVG